MIALAFLIALQGGAKPQIDPSKILLEILAEEKPSVRKKRIAHLRSLHRAGVEGWEEIVRALPSPPLPAEKLKPGAFATNKVKLWTGKKSGVLETSFVLYLPSTFDFERRWPLLIVSHGSGGLAKNEVSMWRSIAEQVGLIVIGADEQLENRGYAFQEHERMTPLALLRWAKLHLPVDHDRVFTSGTSRGGHIVWELVTRWPDHWAGVVPCIGGPHIGRRGASCNLRLVRNVLDVPMRDLQGEGDDPGLMFNLELAFKRLEKARDAKLIKFPGFGHSYDLSAVDWDEFFEKTRDAVPARIRFWCARPARHSWLRTTKLARKVQEFHRPKVKAQKWNAMSNQDKKRYFVKDLEKYTASIELHVEGAAAERMVVVDRVTGVVGMRLLLPRRLWAKGTKGKLRVRAKGRVRQLRVKADVGAFLEGFCERLDLRTAPVRVVDVRL